MKRNLFSLFFIILSLCSFSQDAVSSDSLVGIFSFDGSVKEASGRIKPGKIKGISPAADRFGTAGRAVSLSYDFSAGKKSYVSIPLDINPKKHPMLTITFWIRLNSNMPSGILYVSDDDWSGDKYYRGLFAERYDDYMHFTACCGRDGKVYGSEILAKNWTFVALVYDQPDQAMRLVVNDRVYSSAANMYDGKNFLRIGPFDGQVDELRIWSRVLSLKELESLYGKPISKDTGDYAITRRNDYKGRMAREELEKVQPNTTYIVAEDKFAIHDSAGSRNVIALLAKDDTFRVVRIEKNSAVVLLPGGREGYASVSSVNGKAYPKGSSYLAHELKSTLKGIFNFTNIRSWIIAVVFAILLYFVIKKYDTIDRLLNRIVRRDPLLQGGSKSSGGSSGNILRKIFPLKRLRWWPLTIGAILALVVFIALLWNGHETEWFINDGISLLPSGCTRSVHWFLYISFITLAFLYVVMIIESVVVVGPWMALPRIVILTILMLMSLLVTFYLSVLVLIIAIVMLVLFFLSSAASRSDYQCPYCHRTFRSSPGSSGTCPYCGGSVRT